MTDENQQQQEPGRLDPTLQKVIAAYLEDHQREKKTRRAKWTVLLGLLGVYMAFNVGVLFYDPNKPKGDSYAALVRMDGEIGADQVLSAERYVPVIRQAFDDKKAKGVVLVINSPGGAPTQSQLIHDAIKRNAERTGKRVIVVAEDVMASGAYLIAMSAEKVYAPSTAVVGSIGVVRSGFDASELAAKLGIKDRTYTAGSHKAPFNPLVAPTESEKAKAAELLGELHQEFIGIVKAGRGDRLDKAKGVDLFQGDVWLGRKAVELGLLDGNMDTVTAIQQEFGTDQVKPYKPKLGALDLVGMLGGIASKISAMLSPW